MSAPQESELPYWRVIWIVTAVSLGAPLALFLILKILEAVPA